MNKPSYRDPYLLLGLSKGAGDRTIRKAFHGALQKGGDESELREAYERIKTENSRNKERWFTLESMELSGIEGAVAEEVDDALLNRVIKELAFLTDWELMVEGQ